MLERAKVCLQSGARETLRSSSKTSLSRRALHCDFWSQKAPAIDLAPLLASSSQYVDVTVAKNGGTCCHAGPLVHGAVPSVGTPTNETPFLDFLYPPPVLSLLYRHARAGHQWERWERRNARRLPEGFVQASRGYASRSGGRMDPTEVRRSKENASSSTEIRSGKRQQHMYELGEEDKSGMSDDAVVLKTMGADTAEATTNLKDMSMKKEETIPHDSVPLQEDRLASIGRESGPGTPQQNQSLSQEGPAFANAQAEQDNASSELSTYQPRFTTNDAARDIDAASIDDITSSPSTQLQSLQRIMATARFLPPGSGPMEKNRAERLVDRALSIYALLPKEILGGNRLKLAMIEWLATIDYSVAGDQCISLYESCRDADMPITGYLAAMTVLMRRRSFPALVRVYEDAQQRSPNSQQATNKFLEYVIVEKRWDLVFDTVKKLQATTQPGNNHAGEAMLWVNLSNIPALLTKAFSLVRYTQRVQRSRNPDTDLDLFCAKFCKEALIQELDAGGTPGLTPSFDAAGLRQKFATKELTAVIAQLQHLPNGDTAKTYHSLLLALLQDDARYPFRSVYWLVSYLYHVLRKQDSFRIPEQTLYLILKPLTAHLIASDTQGGSLTSLSISRLTTDWIQDHDKLEWNALKRVMEFFALTGQPDEVVHWMKYVQTAYEGYATLAEVQWTLIRAHAQRIDLEATQDAFNDVQKRAAGHSQALDIRCWNSLLMAYSRADEIDPCLKILQTMIDEDVKADEASFLAVLIVLGKRGDVGAVRNLMSQYAELTRLTPPVQFHASLISAHVKRREMSEAEKVLFDISNDVSKGRLRGSLTWPTNTILMAHAARKDVESTMRIYGWMKTRKIRTDERTFAALMQALVHHAQTNAAWKMLRVVMAEQKLRPNAMHYAIVMRGYLYQNMIEEALMVHDHMTTQNVKHSNATNALYLEAKAKFESATTSLSTNTLPRGALKWRVTRQDDVPLNSSGALLDSIEDLKTILRNADGRDFSSPGPGQAASFDNSSMFGTLIYVHGKHGCFKAVHELYDEFQKQRKDGGHESRDPIFIAEALMEALLGEQDFEEVERYWSLVKQQVDEDAPPMNVIVPDLKKAKQQRSRSSADDVSSPSLGARPTDSMADIAAVGFDASPTKPPAIKSRPLALPSANIPQSNTKQKPASGKAHLISGPLRHYVGALYAQDRIMDMVSTFSEVLNQGYKMDIRTWNTFIEKLCLASPPLTLLAYVLTERYLTPQFPGWESTGLRSVPRFTSRYQGLQYIRARFLAPGLLMPQYSTFVYLGAALLRLRQMENTGELVSERLGPSARYVGSMKQVRTLAPHTLYAVQSMPAIETDPLQARVLRREVEV